MSECTECAGTGYRNGPYGSMSRCKKCDGHGHINRTHDHINDAHKCPSCYSLLTGNHKCTACETPSVARLVAERDALSVKVAELEAELAASKSREAWHRKKFHEANAKISWYETATR